MKTIKMKIKMRSLSAHQLQVGPGHVVAEEGEHTARLGV